MNSFRNNTLRFFFAINSFFILHSSFSQEPKVLINEFCASNVSIINNTEYDDFSDWIELYNTTDSEIDLSGYLITDNLSIPSKYPIPVGVTIASKGYLLLWADNNNTSVHLNFKLSKGGEVIGLYSPEGNLIDSVIFGVQQDDVSFGRLNEDYNKWEFFNPATPGTQNNSSSSINITPEPIFSVKGGFYANTQICSFYNANLVQIYYTMDGTIPDKNSLIYSSPITIDSTVAIRARAFLDGKKESDIITNTFFIGEEINLPIISLVTDPVNFFDNEIGIYITGTNGIGGYCDNTIRNLKQNWERPVNIELYEKDGVQAFNQGAGVKIFGGCSRHRFPQKSLALFARASYGSGSFKYQLFPEKDIDKFESFILRSSADDQVSTLFRDALGQSVLVEHMDLDYQAYRPVAVFLNGKYWGIHNIREKLNEHYIENNYDVNPDEVNILERNGDIVFGTNAGYNTMLDYANSNDLSIQVNYDKVAAQMDIDQYIDYQIGHIYLAERDWPGNNIKFWRANTEPYSKWRWMNYDMDQTFTYEWIEENMIYKTTTTTSSGWPNPEWSTRLFRNLLQNEGFKNKFIQRYAYQMNVSFNPERLIGIINKMEEALEPEIPRHIERWGGQRDPDFNESWTPNETFNSLDLWKENVDIMRVFATSRPEYTINNFTKYFGINRMSKITVRSNINQSGILSINKSIVKSGFIGNYFNEIPLSVSALPLLGYNFSYWEAETTNIASESILAKGSVWKYLDTGTDLDSAWLQKNYDVLAWTSGGAQLGYGDNDETSLVSYGPDANNKYVTTYFKATFDIVDSSKYSSLSLSLLADDGAIVYINGIEVLRMNMPNGNVTYQTLASAGAVQENSFTDFTVSLESIINGTNTIDVEVHQVDVTSSDLSFDCGLSGLYVANTGTETFNTQDLEVVLNGETKYTAFFTVDNEVVEDPILFTEINYNSAPDFDSDDWVEVYNNSGKVINMTSWKFKDETNQDFEFPKDYLFLAGEYLILCKNDKKFKEKYPLVDNIIGNFDFGLSQNGELISILNSNGAIVEEVNYSTVAPWPIAATGTGYTIELVAIEADNTKGENWIATNLHGTPGEANQSINNIETPKFEGFTLNQNYPNPFQFSTTIHFSLPVSERVSLKVYDITGRIITTLLNENLQAGEHDVEFNANTISSGLYYYSLRVGNKYIDTKKMMLIK